MVFRIAICVTQLYEWCSESPQEKKIFSFLKLLLGPPSHLYSGYEVKLPGREVDHWSKNEWSCTSVPPIYRHGMDRDSFTI